MKETKKIELLSPAGSMEALKAAVNAGADAVYLSGQSFGARKFAKNFSNDEIAEAVRHCHIRDVKVYVTVNTLILDSETAELEEYLEFLYMNDVDAVIVQDFGVLTGIRSKFPDMEIHASTQMTLHSLGDVLFMEDLGVKRTVLARELTLDEIGYIKENSKSELEVFCSGALCVSYSGQCLMSAMIGGRSGNRGACAQSCRQTYDLTRNGRTLTSGYLLSTKDLSASELDDMSKLGVIDSLKIEGRMKRPEYIYAIVSTYRAILDGKSKEEYERLNDRAQRVFSRGLTGGFLLDRKKNTMMTISQPGNLGTLIGKVVSYDRGSERIRIRLVDDIATNDEIQIRRKDHNVGARVEFLQIGGERSKFAKCGSVVELPFKKDAFAGEDVYRTVDNGLIEALSEELSRDVQKVGVKFRIDIEVGKQIVLKAIDDKGNSTQITSDDVVQAAQNKPTSREKIVQSVEKCGGTPYLPESVEVAMGDDSFVPVSTINNMRRDALDRISEMRSVFNRGRIGKSFGEFEELTARKPSGDPNALAKPRISACVRTMDSLKGAIDGGADIIVFEDIEFLEDALQYVEANGSGATFLFKPFKIAHDREYDNIEESLKLVKSYEGRIGHTGVMSGNFGIIRLAREMGLPFSTDTSMNTLNSMTFNAFSRLGAESVALSHELSIDDIFAVDRYRAADSQTKTELVVFGAIPVMTTEYCLLASHMKCNECTGKITLRDKMGKAFKVMANENCINTVYNSDILMNIDAIEEFARGGVDTVRLDFLDDDEEFTRYIVGTARSYVDGEYVDFDEVKEKTRIHYSAGITRGLVRRGVQ